MINITLKDGSKLQVENGSTAYDVAAKISQGLAKKALGAKVDGQSVDLMKKLDKDCEL